MIRPLLLTAAIAIAQQPPPAPVFHSGVTFVRVDVVVKDKHGKSVGNLRREDFQIFDNGSPREIRLFLSENESLKPLPRESPTPDTFTNQVVPSASSRGGYSVILIDSIFTDWGPSSNCQACSGAANARVYALRALKSMPAGEKIAIYAATRKLQVVCEFTSDRNLLERQLEQWKASVDTIDAGKAILGPSTSAVLATSQIEMTSDEKEDTDPAIAFPKMDAAQRISASNDQMDLVADHLAAIPGRKNLVWLSNHFVVGPRELQRLKEADVSIYPVNIDGVTGRLDPLKSVLENIARKTGGIAYDMRNDIDIAIREAVNDGRAGYTLGFYQSGDENASSYHHIDVHVSQPDVIVRTYRTEAPRPVSVADLVRALNRPVDEMAVPVKVTATRLQDRVNVKAVVDVGSLELASVEDHWRGRIEIVARFTRADGSTAGDVVSQTLNLNLRPVQQGLGYRNDLKIPPKAVALRMLFANLASGQIGTLTIPLSEVGAGVK